MSSSSLPPREGAARLELAELGGRCAYLCTGPHCERTAYLGPAVKWNYSTDLACLQVCDCANLLQLPPVVNRITTTWKLSQNHTSSSQSSGTSPSGMVAAGGTLRGGIRAAAGAPVAALAGAAFLPSVSHAVGLGTGLGRNDAGFATTAVQPRALGTVDVEAGVV